MSEIKVNKITPRTNCGTTQLGDSGDTVTVTGDLRSDSLKAADGGVIISQSGTNITIGASGDTVSLASGASQSGFGRSGSVDWQTGSIKTATFTATSGEGYFCDTSSGVFTVNLPAGSAGAIVAISDYTRTFNSNNLTISPNGSEKIGGVNGDLALTVNGQALTLVYVDGTEGWINVQNAEDTEVGAQGFLVATGGTITTCGNCKIHTFTGPGTFTVCDVAAVCAPTRNQVSYMVVAGGGGGGNGDNTGGGGAGGFREEKAPLTPYTASPLEGAGAITVTATSFPITVGGGGAGGSGPGGCGATGANGSNSIFSTKTSAGGGGGGGGRPSTDQGQNGGSGGGNGHQRGSSAGSGNTPPVSPSQGSGGGIGAGGSSGPQYGAGGGGGATVAACNGTPSGGGAGGNGATTSISGASTAYAGGGGGGAESDCSGGAGGTGGGGAGKGNPTPGCAGTANTGGGGGGTGCGTPRVGGNGGSGIVIIRYKFQ
jgi:hypothetical protein